MKKRVNSKFRQRPVAKPSITQPIELEIQGYTHDIKGVSRYQGKAVFVEGALLGETVSAKVVREQGRFITAQVDQVIQASEQRVEAQCQYYAQCGGCNLWHMQGDQQVIAKQQILADQLGRHNIQPEKWLPSLKGPLTGYRRRARLGIRYSAAKNKILLGFREKANKHLVDIDNCLVLEPSLNDLIVPFKKVLQTLEAKGSLTQLECYLADNGALMALRHLKPLSTTDTQSLLDFAQEYNVSFYLNDGEIYSSLTDEMTHFYTVAGQKIEFKPGDFLQVNAVINQKMLELALSLLKLKPSDRVLDLFSGLGNFSLPIASQAGNLLGIEGSDNMANRAKQNALNNELHNVSFTRADLSRALNIPGDFDVLVLDPPRAGAAQVVKSVDKMAIKRILYISCDPATLARDAKDLIQQGYNLKQAGVMDMFPQTAHVESIALFEKA